MVANVTQKPPRHIGAFLFRQIGDVLLLTPALAALRAHYPQARITAVVNDFTAPMLENSPDLDQVWTYQRKGGGSGFWLRLRSELALARRVRRAGFDLTLDFTSGDRSAIYSLLSGACQRLTHAKVRGPFRPQYWAYTDRVIRSEVVMHQVRLHLDLLRPLSITVAEPKLVLRLTEAERAWARQQRSTPARPVVVAHLVANWLFKCWDDAKAAQVIDWLQREQEAEVWFTCGPAPAELARARAILALCQTQPRIWLGNLTLRQLAALIGEADAFLGVDTAPMHMAAALGTPLVALFGPTLPAIWKPWAAQSVVLRGECPCERGGQRCDWSGVRACLQATTCDAVQTELARMLEGCRAPENSVVSSETHS